MVIRKSSTLTTVADTVIQSPSIERQGVSMWAWSSKMRQIISVIVLAGILLALHSLLSAITTNAGYQLVGKKQEVMRLTQEIEQLQLDVAIKTSPARIKVEAQKNLGMIVPDMVIYSSANTKGTHPSTAQAVRAIRD